MLRSLTALFLAFSLAGCVNTTIVQPTVSYEHLETSYQTIRDATWQIKSEYSSCSAVAIKPDLLLTAAHCDFPGATIEGKPVVVVKKNEAADIMVIYVLGLNSPALALASRNPAVDQKVMLAGFPMGVGEVVTEGRMQGINTHFDKPFSLVTALGIFGNSGGPMLVLEDGEYKVAGITSALVGAGFQAITHLVLTVPLEEINKILE